MLARAHWDGLDPTIDSRTANDGRTMPRRKLHLEVEGAASESSGTVLIHNLSETGLLIETPIELTTGELIDVAVPHAGPTPARVIWCENQHFGCQFESPISKASVSAALLRAPFDALSAPAPRSAAVTEAAAADALVLSEPHVERYPLRTRVLIMVGLALAAWGVVAALSAVVIS